MAGRLLVLHDPPLDGPTNMARDEHLLYCDGWRPAVLRIYQWSPPTISLGYFQHHADVAALPSDVRGLPVVRRQTGGGAILHDREITYCLVLDDSVPIARRAPADLYRLTHECWRDAMAAAPEWRAVAPSGGSDEATKRRSDEEGSVGVSPALASDELPFPSPRSGPFFCFQQPGRTDLIIGTQKLLGSAQRRITGRVMQHGSLILEQRFGSHPGYNLGGPPAPLVAAWVKGFVQRLAAALVLSAEPAVWQPEHLADVEQRRERYASDAWNRMR